MREPRRHFHQQLDDLEQRIQDMGAAAQDLFDLSLQALSVRDNDLCDRVVAGDDLVDAYYVEIERGIVDVFALQTPVASDLRLLTALLHIDLHLERVADMAVTIAKIVKASSGLPANAGITSSLEEMGGVSLRMLAAAMQAFERRDLGLCRRLPLMDDAVDRLNRGMISEVLAAALDKPRLAWGIAMHLVAREIERAGDHAVDIGEQVAFLVTGEIVEFTDASHPEVERPPLAGAPSA